MSEQKSGKRSCSKLKLHIVKQTGKENTYGNQSKTLMGLILLQKKQKEIAYGHTYYQGGA